MKIKKMHPPRTKLLTIIALFTVHCSLFTVTGCYSVFSGGTSGHVVDAESTSSPKAGIADVDVYAYTNSGDRNSDYNSWNGIDAFVPRSSYYAHTTTNSSGTFTLSKIVWKSKKPSFGKDADVSHVYLLFYHENYGLVKGGTLIVSDSTSDTVYQEMAKTKKTTVLNISIKDVATDSASTDPVLVTILVPQSTQKNPSLAAKKYTQTVTGNAALSVNYPRWQSDDDQAGGIETAPQITINYEQAADKITWKACYNQDNAEKNYAFMETSQVTKTIMGDTFSISLYGKKTELRVPTLSGQYKNSGDESDDGVVVSAKAMASPSDTYSIDCGSATTRAETIGTSSAQSHGNFSGLSNGAVWVDDTYTDKYTTTKVKIFVNGTEKKVIEVRSDETTRYVQLN